MHTVPYEDLMPEEWIQEYEMDQGVSWTEFRRNDHMCWDCYQEICGISYNPDSPFNFFEVSDEIMEEYKTHFPDQYRKYLPMLRSFSLVE
jgi:hypothetical protein